MLHLGAVLPNLTFAADAHYHHLADDVIAAGKLNYQDGAIRVADGPALVYDSTTTGWRGTLRLTVVLGATPTTAIPRGREGSRPFRIALGLIPKAPSGLTELKHTQCEWAHRVRPRKTRWLLRPQNLGSSRES
jgi:hypothetical protein